MDVERARYNMIEQQIRTWDVLDQNVLDLLFKVHREDFLPEAYKRLAFVDMEIPLGYGEVMLSPKLEARMFQELKPTKTDRVLEIGTGSGYMTALLAHEAAHVHTVDIRPEFKSKAEQKLRAAGFDNVTFEVGDAARGWSRHAPYDVIAITGSLPVLPQGFVDALAPGGRLFAIVGDAPAMRARLISCIEKGVTRSADLFETCTRPLVNAATPERFVF